MASDTSLARLAAPSKSTLAAPVTPATEMKYTKLLAASPMRTMRWGGVFGAINGIQSMLRRAAPSRRLTASSKG
jgi:hypothetical protein